LYYYDIYFGKEVITRVFVPIAYPLFFLCTT